MQQGKGRGRGRGRSKTTPVQSPTSPTTDAWVRRPGPSQTQASPSQPILSPRSSQPRPLQSAPSQPGPSQPGPSQPGPSQRAWPRPVKPAQTYARGVRGDAQGYSGGASSKSKDVSIGGGGDASIGRGAMRGRRSVPTDIMLVTRPQNLPTKKGIFGTPVILRANYFKLPSTTNWTLFQYRVDFAPEEDHTLIRKALLRNHKEKLGAYIFDGTVLYTSHRLPEKMDLLSKRQFDDEKITISIKFVGDLAKDDHHYLQFFNIIMRKCLEHLKLQLVGRDYYDAETKVVVAQYKLELWPGYFTSIRQHERDILMCAEITHKVMRQDTLLDIWRGCQEHTGNIEKNFYEEVLGSVVLTDYNNNTYRIMDVDYNLTPKNTFQLKSGESVSYKDYYKNKYNKIIKYDNQPMLVAEGKQKSRNLPTQSERLVYLVPELCRATGLTDNMRTNFDLMQALAIHTRVSPESRIRKLLMFNKRLCSQPNIVKELKEWNLELENNLIEIPGRVLPTEKVVFRAGAITAGVEADWTRELRNKHLLACKPLKNWILIYTSNLKRECEDFLKNLIKVANGMGFNIERPRMFSIADDRTSTYSDALEGLLSKSIPQIVLCVVTNNRSERYSTIKKKCCVDRPVPSQVVIRKNLIKGLSVATKIAIQMNCKLGGVPWCVEVPLSGLMVVGFDVCHDTNMKERDFGAVVATLDKNLTRYISAVSPHCNGEELSNDIASHICKFVATYRQYNDNRYPDRIVIYRDGVGEGQVHLVYNHEVKEIRKRLGQIYGSEAAVKMAFIIVNKRVNTRIFYNERNPPCGTVVDDVITSPVKYDFFIVSQHVKQGTVTPTSYSVIDDTVGLDADKMQRLTYKLTHMYYNWSGTVRVPAPCQYAHKLAYLVGQYVHRAPNTRLEDLLYYL
ncbi:piwi-like protein Siwi [Vespa velutina]|uniref:piwi-like protein Siwi n=1 Tax=Vespa velutina TaxID=202808 RepID=UPI001FB44345|nr:piwi-like protein Siwi [Vespa velutina]